MAYSDFGPPRRSRRRRNVVLLVILLVIVGVLALAVRYRTERRESIDYLSIAEEVSVLHAGFADRLGALLQGLGQEDRPSVILRLESLAVESRDAQKLLDEVTVTRAVAKASGSMTVAAQAWNDGLSAIDDAMVAILDAEGGDQSGDEELRAAFELLKIGDRAYLGVLEAVARLDQELVPADFPEVSYTGQGYAGLYDAAIIAERLRRVPTLSEVMDVAIVGTTVPSPVSEGVGGIWAIPASDTFVVEVTVSNNGNVAAENISVIVTLQQLASSDKIDPFGRVIPAIEAGASEVLVFSDLAPEAGLVYTVTATATLGGDVVDETDDNSWTLSFERNAE
jgi:hypothetical protein